MNRFIRQRNPSYSGQVIARRRLGLLEHSWIAIGFSSAVFALFWLPTHFPYLVDEYDFLAARTAGGFSLLAFKTYLPLRPWFALINFEMFQSGAIRFGKAFILLYFVIHAVSFSWLAEWFVERLGIRLGQVGTRSAWIASLGVMLLYPSHYEILYMFLNLPYSLGLLALVAGIRARNRAFQAFFLWAAFLSLETYVLPAAALLGLEATWDFFSNRDWKKFLKGLRAPVTVFVAAYLAFWLTVRLVSRELGISFEDRGQLFHQTAAHVWGQARLLNGFLWHLHFYKAFWLPTVVQWAVLLGFTVFLVRKRELTRTQALWLFVLPYLAGIHNLILPYYAPRAVFGAVEVRNAAIVLVLFLGLSKASRIRGVAVFLLLICHLAVTTVIFQTKTANSRAITETEVHFVTELRACADPCHLRLPPPNQGIKRDWMMIPEYYPAYFHWIRDREVPGKSFTFEIVETP